MAHTISVTGGSSAPRLAGRRATPRWWVGVGAAALGATLVVLTGGGAVAASRASAPSSLAVISWGSGPNPTNGNNLLNDLGNGYFSGRCVPGPCP